MSGTEDLQDASEQDDTQDETTETAEVSDEVASSIEESDDGPAEPPEKTSAKESEVKRGEVKEKEQTEEERREETPGREETQKEETSDSELAAITRSASSDDGAPAPVTGFAANEPRRGEPGERRTGAPAIADGGTDGRRDSGHVGAAVGEWNSLPVLVERLRAALELSLAGYRRGDVPTATTSPASAGVGGDRTSAHRRMEQAVLGVCDDPIPGKDELKFLEDLLLSDIQTALSRLRETLEHTDVAALAKHGGVSDPTSKLHLLRLVSSLLSRLQVPREEEPAGENGTVDVATLRGGASPARRRRAVRHTIGVSAEEIAHARRQLEESSADLARLNELSARRQRDSLPAPAPSNSLSNGEKHVLEEIHDKCTKDAINQRQSLLDKNKDCRGDNGAYRPAPSQTAYADRPVAQPTVAIGESSVHLEHQEKRQCSVNDYREKENDDEETVIRRASEEQSRVTKLAATLRQRAELALSARYSANNNANNKFTAKKSKIKRANTVDIPSYLKLQGDSLGYDSSGCVLLRRPINVGDKVTSNAANNFAVPSFHPRTENDKKFLALISRNNETQATFNAAPAFKPFGYTKATDMSSLTNENWNSRFSNIKIAFDKPSSANDENKQLSPKPRPANRFPIASQTPAQVTNKKTPTGGDAHNGLPFANVNVPKPDAGFKHAPSSLFRKIEKPQSPKSPPGYQRYKDNAPPPSNTLREKARIMFDRDSNVQSQPSSKFRVDANENLQRSVLPRPPWIEHVDRNAGKSSNMVTENGKLDYRLFCKQFAPFIGKNAVTETKHSSRNTEEAHKRNEHSKQRRDLVPPNDKQSAVDGRISFRMFPEKGSQARQYCPGESRRDVDAPVRDKFDLRSEKDSFEPIRDRRCNDKGSFIGTAFAKNALPTDETLSGSSSAVIQRVASGDDRSEEARVFRVASGVSRGSAASDHNNNNASVRTYGEPEEPAASHVEPTEQWTAPRCERIDANLTTLDSSYRPVQDPRHFVVDHNQNFHTVAPLDVAPRSEISPSMNKNTEHPVRVPDTTENVSFQTTSGYHPPFLQTNPQYENYFPSKPAIDDRSQIYQNYPPYVKSSGDPFENQAPSVPCEIDRGDFLRITNEDDGGLPAEQNIQNQDISADVGVVTRYTCAIATVAFAELPDTRPDVTAPVSGASSSPSSPSRLCSHPKSISDEATTTEDEIRRHNMLQQSLVRRLQNERATLNDRHAPVPNQPSTFDQPPRLQPRESPRRPEPPKRSEPPRRPEPPRRSEPPRRTEPPRRSEPSRKPEPSRKLEHPRRLEPPVVTGLLSMAPFSGSGVVNRVTALREQYEQPGGQSKPTQKERSPTSNDVSGSAMDSSDEYLVSCSNRPSRSIVLSKSESWHQLAVYNSQRHTAPRASQDNLPPSSSHSSASYLPKPPKPKSPSSFKMKKQYEASSDSVKKMEDKIRMYFDNPNDGGDARDSKGRRSFSSRDSPAKGPVGLSRSRTMPGMCDEGSLRLLMPAAPPIPAMSLNSADVDKVFDDIFEEATRVDDHRF